MAFTGTTILILAGLFVFAGFRLFWILKYDSALWNYRHPKSKGKPPVSVVIAARNEGYHLEDHLKAVLEQKYPEFEVVVIDDGSWDDTRDILDRLARVYKNLKQVNVGERIHPFSGKKFALMLGIKAATHEHLLFTDADCKPASENWISEMMTGFETNIQMVLGFGAYKKVKSTAGLFAMTDLFINAVSTFGVALRGVAYSGVGRNLAYLKSRFHEAGGFRSHYSIASGDDDLVIQSMAKAGNCQVVLAKDAFTISAPPQTWKDFFRQKRRHLSTGKRYKKNIKFLLAFNGLSYLLWPVFAVICLCYPLLLVYGIVALLLLFALQIIIFSRASRLLNQSRLYLLVPFTGWVLVLFTLCAHIANRFSKPKGWKN